MKNFVRFLQNKYSIITEVILLSLSIFWLAKTSDTEPLIAVVTFSLALLGSLLSTFVITEKPRLEIEFKPNGGGKTRLAVSGRNPINEEGVMVMEPDTGLYINKVHWDYELIIRNNSTYPAFYPELFVIKSLGNLNIKYKINKQEPIPAMGFIKTDITYTEIHEEPGEASNRRLRAKYPEKLRTINILIKYKNELDQVLYSEFSFVEDEAHNNHELKRRHNLKDYTNINLLYGNP